jgi:hypothetical protein
MTERFHHQTTRLGRGRHDGPGEVVCVMELASMLTGEPFSDRPATVCSMIAALLRAYNDVLDDDRRQDLYRYSSDSVGTRGDYALERRRAGRVLEVAAASAAMWRRGWRRLVPRRVPPDRTAGPESIAEYLVWSSGRPGDASHARVLSLIDELIAMTPSRVAPATGSRPRSDATLDRASGGATTPERRPSPERRTACWG